MIFEDECYLYFFGDSGYRIINKWTGHDKTYSADGEHIRKAIANLQRTGADAVEAEEIF